MTKMGISSMLHSGDTLVAVYTAQGDLVSAVLGTYLHCGDRPGADQVHPRGVRRRPVGRRQRGRRLLHERGAVRRHPQPRPVRDHAGVPRGRADRVGRLGRPPVRDRRQRAGRRDHAGAHAPRRGHEAHADQDRRALPAQERPAADDGELHLPCAADAGHRRQGACRRVRPCARAAPGAGRPARSGAAARPVPADDPADVGGRAHADRGLARRRLPPQRLHGHDRPRGCAAPCLGRP